MKKLLLFFVLIMAGANFVYASKIATYSIPLTRVEMLQADSVGADPIKILASDADGLMRSQYEDSRIQVIWKCDGIRFRFILLNKTNYPLTIDWDKIICVDTEGEIGNVIHNGTKYNERNSGQLKTIIPKMAKLNDFLVPSKNCVFNRGGYFTVGRWQENYLFPCVYKNAKDLNSHAPNLIGKTMRLEFPIVINDIEYNYTFYFELSDLAGNAK